MNNQTDIGLKFSNDITNTDKLEKYASNLERIKSVLQAFDSGKLKEVDSAVAVAGSSTNQSNIKKTGSALNGAFEIGKLGIFAATVKKLSKTFSQMANSSATYLENMNLLDVAYNNDTTAAEKLVNRMTEMYGLDESWGYRTVGMFKQLANAMDITGETGTKMANVLSLLAVDLSSLYNVNTTESVEKLESALAGQTKPIRSYGADITEMTLQQTLLNNSINLTVDELSFAEKRLLIVSAILQQTKESNNDWARTIESLANQMRIFDEQISRLTRSIGNIFLPVLKAVLPYINAFLMVLVEITSWIAALVGYDPSEFDFFTDADTGINDFSTSVDGLGSSLDSASDSAKKLKQGLRGFDKLNNITTPTTSSGSSGGSSGGGTGISSDILDLFNKTTDDYLSKLTDVEMKATRIRDKIMEWLGFTKQVDDETGDVSFKFDHITGGTVLGALGVGGVIYKGISGILSMLSKIGLVNFELPGLTQLIGSFAKFTGITGFVKDLGAAFSLIKDGTPILEALGQVAPALGEMLKKFGGIFSIAFGIYDTFSGIKDIINNGWNFDGIMDALAGILEIVGGILLFVNPIAGVITLAIAGVVKLTQLIVDNWDIIKSTVIGPIVDFISGIAAKVYDKAIKPIIDFFEPILSVWHDFNSQIWQSVSEIASGIWEAAKTIFNKIKEIFSKIIEIYKVLGTAFYTYVISPIWNKWIKPAFTYIYNTLIKPIIKLFSKVGTWVYNNIISPIWKKILWLRDKAVTIFKSIGTTVINFVSGSIKKVINGLLAVIENKINTFIRMLNKVIKLINKIPGADISPVSELNVPRLKTGIDYVPKDFYLSYLDEGERVLTKQENQDYTRNKMSGSQKQTPQTIIVQIGNKEFAKVVLDDLQDTAKNLGRPITIGG